MSLSPATIIELLAPVYGMPMWVPHHDPVSELVLTVLSQNTNDSNSGRAFNRMMQQYEGWSDILAADPAELVETIRTGGLAETKAPRIQTILAAVRERSGDFDLAFLDEMSINEARSWLTSLPGVGPKTAACVLLFSMGRPALPVDTHVERVSKRLGLIPERTSATKAHVLLEAQVDVDDYYAFHVLLIKHGRRLCSARTPDCGHCPLLEAGCPWGRAQFASGS